MARLDSRASSADGNLLDPSGAIAAALEYLPVAVGLVDSFGRYVARSRALLDVLGDMIPSRSPDRARCWTINDEHGVAISPRHWPGSRALRGETVLPGQMAT